MTAKMMTKITDPDFASLVSMWEGSEWRVSRVITVADLDEPLVDDDEPDWEAMRDYTDEYREAHFA